MLVFGGYILSISESLKKGTAEIVLLALLNESDMYGYQIIQELTSRSENLFILKEGSMYPILYRLQEKGYITCRQEKVLQKRVRIYYHLELSGKSYLETILNEYREISKGIDKVLEKSGGILFNE